MKRMTILATLAVLIAVVAQIGAWVVFVHLHHRAGGFGVVLVDGAVAFLFTGFLLYLVLAAAPMPVLILNALTDLSFLLVSFASLYWNLGTAQNFGSRLSHTSALYFAVGTMTTAGTGNINAHTDVARAAQTVQMLVDFAFIGVAAALLLARLASSRAATRP